MIKNLKLIFKDKRYLKNIYKTNYKKNVLISYTIFPFLHTKKKHTNFQESKAIGIIFKELGYNVDIIHFTNQKIIKYKKYDVIFGFGHSFENSFSVNNLKRIYYATGAHVFHQNYAEIKRIVELNKKLNTNLLPKRIIPWNWSLSTSFSDVLIVIGNEWTKSTYKKYTNKPIYKINATALMNKNSKNISRNINKTKKSYLWFGSVGLVHKGLDLCLEYFSNNQHLTLHICCPMEENFKMIFKQYFNCSNIHYHGFINVLSQNFLNITSKCSFCILPTCSEGQATALLTAMSTGLIPISTKFCGIDLIELGLTIDELNLISLDKTISESLKMNDFEIEMLSKHIFDYIKKNHSIKTYSANLKQLLIKIL